MKSLVDIIFKIQIRVSFVLFVSLTLVVFLQVVSRYVFHNPFIWSEEVARFLFFWVVLMGSSISVKNNKHFVIDVLDVSRIKNRKLRAFLNMFPHLCIFSFSIFLIIYGLLYFELGRFRVGSNSEINMAFVYLAIPVAGITQFIYSLYNLICEAKMINFQAAGEK
jgi:TRAP-type C4-dicarboxylate transport system permease small subunit